MNSPMMRRGFLVRSVMAVAGSLSAGTLLAAPKTYRYRCPRCQLIETYAKPGIKKCPKCGFSMIKVD
jgi:ribosomal protein S27AE